MKRSKGQVIVGCRVTGAPHSMSENELDVPPVDRRVGAGTARSGPLSNFNRILSKFLSCSADVPTDARSQASCKSVSPMTDDEDVGFEVVNFVRHSLVISSMTDKV